MTEISDDSNETLPSIPSANGLTLPRTVVCRCRQVRPSNGLPDVLSFVVHADESKKCYLQRLLIGVADDPCREDRVGCSRDRAFQSAEAGAVPIERQLPVLAKPVEQLAQCESQQGQSVGMTCVFNQHLGQAGSDDQAGLLRRTLDHAHEVAW